MTSAAHNIWLARRRIDPLIPLMDISLFDYDLPRELIAQEPLPERDSSRLMVLDRQSKEIELTRFSEIVRLIPSGSVMVVNNTKVFKARLLGRRTTGGQVEVFLLRRRCDSPDSWEAMVRPSKRLSEGEAVLFGNGGDEPSLCLILSEHLGGGRWRVSFDSAADERQVMDTYGHVPLPQYIKRPDRLEDMERYQTVFARADRTGAVAAPTAGLHFTSRLLQALRDKGVEIVEVTLHVGPGTFKPVVVQNIEQHSVDPEFASLTAEAADSINRVRAGGGKVVAVGTTSVRVLESAKLVAGEIQPFSGEVDLFIRPGHTFKIVDQMITNFHLPKSSLLILVSAFAGRERILNSYQQAIQEQMRFYSYGDAMLIR